MTPRTLWTIILKIFGIYLFLQALPVIWQLFSILAVFFNPGQKEDLVLELFLILFWIGIYLLVVFIFIFRNDWLINRLKLCNGIAEEKLEINYHRSDVLKVVVILSGLMLFVETVPTLFRELYAYFQQINVYTSFKQSSNAPWIIWCFIKLLFALFMMSSSRLIVNFIERKRKDKVKTEEKAA